MKQRLIYCAFLMFLIFLVYSSKSSARSLATEIERVKAEVNEITGEDPLLQQQLEGSDQLMNQLMGLEVCDREDEECIKRRIISEAHLDYIYTQQHKP